MDAGEPDPLGNVFDIGQKNSDNVPDQMLIQQEVLHSARKIAHDRPNLRAAIALVLASNMSNEDVGLWLSGVARNELDPSSVTDEINAQIIALKKRPDEPEEIG